MIVVDPMPLGRAGAAIAGFAEIIARLLETARWPLCGIAGSKTARPGRDIKGHPVPEHAGGGVRILDHEDEALGSIREVGPRQWRRNIGAVAGVLRRVSAPGGKAPLASISGMALSALPECHSKDKEEGLLRGDREL